MPLTLSARDQAVIWHPYTQHKQMVAPIPISYGKGALLYDEKNNAYIDAISSWWVNIHGHAHPYIAEKIYEQAKKLQQVIFTSFTHEPAVLLAERLLMMLPGNFSKVFFSDNGSTAVEVAIKMAIQYWKNQPAIDSGGTPSGKRSKILAFRNAYHGDTFGSMSVSERGVFTLPFHDYLFDVIFIDTPTAENVDALKRQMLSTGDEIACFIYEPLLQAAGGMLMHQPGPLDELLQTLQAKNVICIADEVMTGFGRTGKLFAGEFLRCKPDIICLSKGLTGGVMAMGVTACSFRIFEAFLSDDKLRTFFHGHSYTANPLACSAALASLDLLQKEECFEQIRNIQEQNERFINQLETKYSRIGREGSPIRNLRQLGTVLAFEIAEGADSYLNLISARITQRAIQEGIYLRPLGNTVYIMPPYCITIEQLERIYIFLNNLFG